MQIHIDITAVATDPMGKVGNKISDLRNIGIVPNEINGGRDLHVSNHYGSRVVVSDYATDEVIVSGNGWSNAMQALANHYQVPVQVSRGFQVTGGKSGKVLGYWAPEAAAPAAPVAGPTPTNGTPALIASQYPTRAAQVQPGSLIHVSDGEWFQVLSVATTGNRAIITYGDEYQARKLFREIAEPVLVASIASLRLTKAQADLLRHVAAGRVHYSPGNHDWAPAYAARRGMFQLVGHGKTSNRTLAASALDMFGLIKYNSEQSWIVEPTAPALEWLATHPA
jgi:hypothetical protein